MYFNISVRPVLNPVYYLLWSGAFLKLLLNTKRQPSWLLDVHASFLLNILKAWVRGYEIQEGQLSVSGERICTRLVNR